MIAQISGRIIAREERSVVVLSGQIGWRLFISTETRQRLPAKDQQAKLWTYLAVRETALELYGFHDQTELKFFELLIAISGVGPKSALAILSLAPPATLTRAVNAGDLAYLTKVSGIGRKTAEKIILELGDKIGGAQDDQELKEESGALEALHALGYTLAEAREALKRIPTEAKTTNEKIKAALKTLSR